MKIMILSLLITAHTAIVVGVCAWCVYQKKYNALKAIFKVREKILINAKEIHELPRLYEVLYRLVKEHDNDSDNDIYIEISYMPFEDTCKYNVNIEKEGEILFTKDYENLNYKEIVHDVMKYC